MSYNNRSRLDQTGDALKLHMFVTHFALDLAASPNESVYQVALIWVSLVAEPWKCVSMEQWDWASRELQDSPLLSLPGLHYWRVRDSIENSKASLLPKTAGKPAVLCVYYWLTMYTGYGLEVDRDHFDNMLTFNLKDGKQWRKRIYPRFGYPNKLLRWATAEVCG